MADHLFPHRAPRPGRLTTESSSRPFADRIRFGRLDAAASRLDRERAERALHTILPEHTRQLVWADDLPNALSLVVGKTARSPFGGQLDGSERLWQPSGRGPAGVQRINRVAAVDTEILRASRHVATARVAIEERLAYRISIPGPLLVSHLARAVVGDRRIPLEPGAATLAAELAAAGVQALWFLDQRRVVAVARPDVSLAGGDLHALAEPAVRWGEQHLWFWRGIWIPEHIGARREQLGLADVLGIHNVERRGVVVGIVGFERLAREAGDGAPAQEDDYGRLWRLGPLLDEEECVAVEVVNSTAEPDGSYRRYFLRVPPAMRTAREAIAWTFDMNDSEYLLSAQS